MSHPGVVLVVEDHREIREMVRAILEQEGYATAGASNGIQALEALHREAIQFALQRGSRSGRVAWQFARAHAGARALKPAKAR